MNTKAKLLIALLALSLAALLSSCNSSSNSGGNAGTANTLGTITALGSITVNGVKFETNNAEVEIGDAQATDDSGLRVGMVSEVQGTINADGTTGTATVVTVPTQVEGPIDAIDITSPGLIKQLTILGQTTVIEAGVTVFDSSDPTFTFASMAVGEVVSANGLIRDDGVLIASFIEKKAEDLATFLAAGKDLEVRGKITTLDTTAQTFTINALIVDYSGAALQDLENAPGGVLANDLLVEVHSIDFLAGTLIATRVEVKMDGLAMADAVKAEVEGFIASLDTAAKSFTVNGQPVDYSNAQFRSGLEVDLLDGIKVEAEGPMTNGVILATKVTFKSTLKIEGNVAVINGDGTFTVDGLPGITITANDLLTRFDNANALADIAVGNNMRIRARKSGSDGTTLMATRLTVRNASPDTRLILQGPVESFDANSGIVTILGIDVDTSSISNDNFEVEDSTIGRTAFFDGLTVGTLVKARADLGPPIAWDQIELELEE